MNSQLISSASVMVLSQRLNNSTVELLGILPGKGDFLCQVIREQFDQAPIALFV